MLCRILRCLVLCKFSNMQFIVSPSSCQILSTIILCTYYYHLSQNRNENLQFNVLFLSIFYFTSFSYHRILQSFAPVLVFTSQKGVQSDFIGVLPSTIKSLYQCFRNPSKIFTLFHFCFFDRGLGKIFISWNLNFIWYSFVMSLFFPLLLLSPTTFPFICPVILSILDAS